MVDIWIALIYTLTMLSRKFEDILGIPHTFHNMIFSLLIFCIFVLSCTYHVSGS